jgi:hypothetical protein
MSHMVIAMSNAVTLLCVLCLVCTEAEETVKHHTVNTNTKMHGEHKVKLIIQCSLWGTRSDIQHNVAQLDGSSLIKEINA